MQGTMWLFPNSRECRIGIRESGAVNRKLEAFSQEPEAGTGDSGIGESKIESRKPTARSRKPSVNSRQPKASTVPLKT